MKGLLLKDLYSLKRYALWYALMLIIFSVLAILLKNTAFVIGLAVFLPLSVSSVTINCDEKDNWIKYALSCGIRPSAIAAEKYLITLVSGIPAAAMWLVTQYAVAVPSPADWLSFVILISAVFVVAALVIPLAYKFGTEKGRLFLTLVMLLTVVAVVGVSSLVGETADMSAMTVLYILLPAGTAAALVVSGLISVNILKNKNF